jgi:hypothetical protein
MTSPFDGDPMPMSQEDSSTSFKREDSEDSDPLVKLTFTYIKRYSDYRYRQSHFTRYLKDNQILTSHCKAITQLDTFLKLYFPNSILRKTFMLPSGTPARYSPYPLRPVLGSYAHNSVSFKDEDVSSEDDNIPSTPPSTPPSPPPNAMVKRTGSLMDTEGSVRNPAVATPPAPPVNVNINIFNGTPTSPNGSSTSASSASLAGAHELKTPKTEAGVVELMSINVVLPDDSQAVLKVPSTYYVSDLRQEVQNRMLQRYPSKTKDDIPLERLRIKAGRGWPLNLADRLTTVIHEGTVVHCHYHDNY